VVIQYKAAAAAAATHSPQSLLLEHQHSHLLYIGATAHVGKTVVIGTANTLL